VKNLAITARRLELRDTLNAYEAAFPIAEYSSALRTLCTSHSYNKTQPIQRSPRIGWVYLSASHWLAFGLIVLLVLALP